MSLIRFYKHYSKTFLNEALIKACINNQLEDVKYLLTSPELKERADIHCKEDQAFESACFHGHLDIVKYLSSSLELKEHAYVNLSFTPLINAIQNDHLEVVKYLISSPDLKTTVDPHLLGDYPFMRACDMERVEILQYFIFELNFEKNEDIKKFFNKDKNKNNEFIKTVDNMFTIRDLNNKLESELVTDGIKVNSIKKSKL